MLLNALPVAEETLSQTDPAAAKSSSWVKGLAAAAVGADAAAAGFTAFETEEEKERVPPLVMAAVADSTDFDIDTYRLKSELASENEDGD